MQRLLLLSLALAIALAGCATDSRERKAGSPIDDDAMAGIGATAFDQLKLKGRLSADYDAQSFVRCVADNLIAELPAEEQVVRWEILAFEDPGADAYALPGGKLGVHRELLAVVDDEAQLAALIAHELAHVGQRHSAQRLASEFSTESAVAAVQTFRGDQSPAQTRSAFALLGLGNRVGMPRPYSRAHEVEADNAALALMARAGYSPTAAPQLWRTLAEQRNAPSWLSNHPDPERHVEVLEDGLDAAVIEFDTALANGRQPRCR
jgi:predicted Zn-dependent protease